MVNYFSERQPAVIKISQIFNRRVEFIYENIKTYYISIFLNIKMEWTIETRP